MNINVKNCRSPNLRENLLISYRICIEERDESIIGEEEEHAAIAFLERFRHQKYEMDGVLSSNKETEERKHEPEQDRLEQLSVSEESLPRNCVYAFLFGLLSARRRKGEGGLEKFNRGKKSIRLLRALFRYENTLVNCRRKNKIASWFEARSSYRNV